MNSVFANFLFFALLLISHTISLKLSTKINLSNAITIQGNIRNIDDQPITKNTLLGFNTVFDFMNIDTLQKYRADIIQDGYYKVVLPPGRYLRHIVSDGYFESLERLIFDKENNSSFEHYNIYLTSNGNKLSISPIISVRGYIKDATTNKLMTDALLASNKANITFTNIDTNKTFHAKILPGAIYEASLPVGNYTRQASLENFSDSVRKMNFKVSSSEKESTNRIFLSKEVNGFRMVLTWLEVPRDLDSHLILPSGKEVNYDNKIENHITLDVDNREGYGPETITAMDYAPGTHTYYVHKYSEDGSLSGCNARVEVFQGNKQILDIYIPNTDNTEARYWHVFNFIGSTGKLEVVNKLLTNAPINPDAPAINNVYYNPSGQGANSDVSSQGITTGTNTIF
jgi:hypothetical protein